MIREQMRAVTILLDIFCLHTPACKKLPENTDDTLGFSMTRDLLRTARRLKASAHRKPPSQNRANTG